MSCCFPPTVKAVTAGGRPASKYHSSIAAGSTDCSHCSVIMPLVGEVLDIDVMSSELRESRVDVDVLASAQRRVEINVSLFDEGESSSRVHKKHCTRLESENLHCTRGSTCVVEKSMHVEASGGIRSSDCDFLLESPTFS